MTTEQRFQRVERELDEVRQLLASAATYAQSANQNCNQLSGKVSETNQNVDRVSQRIDEFVFQAQRLFNQLGGKVERTEGLAESLTPIVQKLDRNFEAQQYQLGEFQGWMREITQQIALNQQNIIQNQQDIRQNQQDIRQNQQTINQQQENINRILEYLENPNRGDTMPN